MSAAMGAGSAAEKMDGIYRRQRHIYDLTRRYYLLGRDRLIADLGVPQGGSVLEVGCGTARNLILAARRYPSAKFYGLDVSEEMLRTARASVERHGLTPRIALAVDDATDFDAGALFDRATFDRVFISYALSMIPGWERVVPAAARCLATGGELHIVDFGDFAGYPAVFTLAQRAWLRRFSVTPIADFEARIKELADSLGLAATAKRHYGGYAIRAR
ncbi:MAG: class I SAM-dependent methyltransferase [Rhodomicrobium sp.]|nr:class I SAM-dependent methyltransferase [Rhodomicrobium sp.]